jgi:hypothetical protein
LLLERRSQAVKARFPQIAVLRKPLIEFAERLRPETIKSPLSIRPHRNEACFVEDTQVTGDTRLVDSYVLNDVVDLQFAIPQGFDNATACRVGKDLEGV